LIVQSGRLARPAKALKGPYKKSEESRQQVLEAAITTLAKHGIQATSVQDIADAAGMSKGSVHYHFESKDELLERVLEACCERIERRITAVFDEPGLPLDRVRRALVEMWAVRREVTPEYRVLMDMQVVARQNVVMQRALAAALGRARRQMVDIGLAKFVEMGLRPKVSIEVIPRLILATLDGLAVHHYVDPVTPQEEVELLRALEATALALFEL
jgi:AcrR family transcriptional regulator